MSTACCLGEMTASAETISSSGERFAGVTCTETIGSFSFSEELQPNPAIMIARTPQAPENILGSSRATICEFIHGVVSTPVSVCKLARATR